VKVVADVSGGLKHPIQAIFTPDARALLVSDNGRNCVWRVDVASGRVSELVRPGAGGLDAPSALALQGDVLYVGSRLGKKVLKFDARDGAFIGTFADLPSNPEFFVAGK
jgi:sugar lactone lactonase YvrE